MLCLAPAPCLLLLVYSVAKNYISSFPEYFRTVQIMHKSISIKELWILQRLILRKQKSTFHFSNLLPIWEGKHSGLNRGSFSNPLSFKCRGAKRLEFGGLRFKSPTLLLMSLEKNSASVSLSVQMSSSTAARATCRTVKIKCHIALKQGSLRWNLLVVIYWWWGREYANTSGKGSWLAVSIATEGVMPRLMLEIARWDLIASNTFLVHSSLCNHVSKISLLPEQISMCFLIRETVLTSDPQTMLEKNVLPPFLLHHLSPERSASSPWCIRSS